MALTARDSHLRERKAHEHSRVTFVELFFDLVFVFAVTQLSHSLLAHPDLPGLLHTSMVFLAVWWAWMYMAWFTNWLDPEHTPVRVLLMVQMLAGLAMSTSLPDAFGDKGLIFAGAYVFMQVGRGAFALWAFRDHSPGNYLNFQRIICWQILAGAFWISGALVQDSARLALWAAALLIDCGGPPTGYYTPGLGRSASNDWDVEGGHMAERCALFIIIALGESILVTGATFAALPMTAPHVAGFAGAFIGSVAMWWIYFDTGADRGSKRIAEADDPGRLARLSYTYLHIPLVAGIIVTAVADEMVLGHPTGHTSVAAACAIVGGPVLYLIGNLLFKRSIVGRWPLSHLVGMGLFCLIAPAALVLAPLPLSALTTLVLLIVAAWETRSLRGNQRDAGADAI